MLGAAALLVLLAVRRERLPRDRGLWLRLVVVGLLLNALPYTLFAYGQTHISSVLAGLWNATTPLLTLLAVLVAFREEQPRREAVLGLLVGFAGAVVVLGPWEGLGGGALIGSLACLAATACYGVGIPYARRHVVGSRSESMVALAAAQLVMSSLLLLLVLPFAGPLPDDVDLAPVASLVALGALGTGMAFALSNYVLRVAGATVASTVTYVIPLFSTALGVLVLDEHLRWNEPVGAAVVLAGVALGQRRRTETTVSTSVQDEVDPPAVHLDDVGDR